MSAPHHQDRWLEDNQRLLMLAVADVRACLEQHTGAGAVAAGAQAPAPPPDAGSALDALCAAFRLSPFERRILTLCAALELDSSLAALCGTAQGDAARNYPTFSLALAALPGAHWSALTPQAPLRRWKLIELAHGTSLTTSLLRIDERVLHYLTGVSQMDERVAILVEPLEAAPLAPSHLQVAERVAMQLSRAANAGPLPAIQLCGDDTAAKRAVAATVCEALGWKPYLLFSGLIPASATELDTFLRLWERESALGMAALVLDAEDGDADALRIARFCERNQEPLLLLTRQRQSMRGRQSFYVDVAKPGISEQRLLWQHALGSAGQSLNGGLDLLLSQFHLGASTIRATAREVLSFREAPGSTPVDLDDLASSLWDGCRRQARPSLDGLAQRIEPTADWGALVLPDAPMMALREIAAQARQRALVYGAWGFGSRGQRGLGVSVLFSGPSGTGKTLAAEVLARDLRLDLYRIDLSQVVSKYIGEAEKALRRIFEAAEEGGAVLLFDEADALFGKRSEVKDSHDRYANIEVSYLLQRMEEYRGLAILTTNRKGDLDPAFLRRIRFLVNFPFPDVAQRHEIWKRVFPRETPTEDLDVAKLSRLNLAGGSIRNIAMNGAFLAADEGEPVRMRHLSRAARTECAKLERPLAETDLGGW